MCGKAAKVELTTDMQDILRQLSVSRSLGNAVVARAKIVWLGFERLDNQAIGAEVELSSKTVGLWRRRWRDSFPALLRM